MGAGAPLGNHNATRGRRWRDAVEFAVAAWPKKPDCTDCSALIAGLRLAAHKFVGEMMTSKDISFFREFGDRLDGKPAQAIIGGDADDPPLRIERIERVIVDPKP